MRVPNGGPLGGADHHPWLRSRNANAASDSLSSSSVQFRTEITEIGSVHSRFAWKPDRTGIAQDEGPGGPRHRPPPRRAAAADRDKRACAHRWWRSNRPRRRRPWPVWRLARRTRITTGPSPMHLNHLADAKRQHGGEQGLESQRRKGLADNTEVRSDSIRIVGGDFDLIAQERIIISRPAVLVVVGTMSSAANRRSPLPDSTSREAWSGQSRADRHPHGSH